jgi:ABC-2 type transport system ATP-binding protein
MSIRAENVTKYYGEQKALDSVSFEVKAGEIVGFLGPNGAGKSTMMKIITGFLPASSGKVYINGRESGPEDTLSRRHIGYLPENNPLYPEMYIREYLGFVASVYGLRGRAGKSAVDAMITLTGLSPEKNKKIGALSRGYRQRVGLAQALIHSPSVLILDEATNGLDPNQIIEIRALIRNAGINKTVLLSTHIMQEAEAICDRVIIIDKGVIVADQEKSAIYSLLDKKGQKILAEFDRDPDKNLMLEIPGVASVNQIEKGKWEIEAEGVNDDIRPAIFSFAVKNNLTVLALQKLEGSLEEVFRHLTN